MSTKEKVSSEYLKNQQHLKKPYRDESATKILISGNEKSGSIGEAIFNFLDCSEYQYNIKPTNVDVTKKIDLTDDADVLIMCHGYTYLDWIEDAKDDQIRNILEVNLYGTINLLSAFVRSTIDSPYRKKIISIGSMAYSKVLNGSSAYCAAKAGIAHFIRCAAWELAPKGYDVYCIHPSNVDDTPMAKDTIRSLQRYRNLTKEEAEEYWSSSYIRNRSLTKIEIAELVYFLLKPEAEFLSGQQFELTGGQR